MHDAGGLTLQATLDALPRNIEYFKKRGYKFTTVADIMGKTKEGVMPKLPPSRDSWLSKVNFFFAEATYCSSHVLFALFIVGIALSVGRMLIMAFLAWLQKKIEVNNKLLAAPVVMMAG